MTVSPSTSPGARGIGQGIVSPLITCGIAPSWAIAAAGTAINNNKAMIKPSFLTLICFSPFIRFATFSMRAQAEACATSFHCFYLKAYYMDEFNPLGNYYYEISFFIHDR
jgi:hypothetical protein